MDRTSTENFFKKQRHEVAIDPHKVHHFEKGSNIVVVNDEGGLWNRKPMKKTNIAHKESHAFDFVKY